MQSRQIKAIFCKNRLQLLCIVIAVILSVGLVSAILLSDDTRWTNWSLSRLGETSSNRLSAFLFNTAVFLASLLMMLISFFMKRGYVKLGQLRPTKVSGWGFALLSVCMMGVALCPNDIMHAAHFVFSRSIVILMVVLMFALPSSLGCLTRRERLLSFSFPVFASLMAAQGYIMGKFWFVIVEVLLGVFAMIWLFFICRQLDLKLADMEIL